VTNQPPDIDAESVAAQLADQFGGTWKHWVGGNAGIPGANLWAQYRPDGDGRSIMVGMLLLADGLTSARLRAIPVGALEMGAAAEATGGEEQLRADLSKLPALTRGELSSEEFYKLVAEHFRVWVQHSTTPVAEMARESGEKPATVHAWVNRARGRGLLPEAERGKRARG
jgi:hypothetical protein